MSTLFLKNETQYIIDAYNRIFDTVILAKKSRDIIKDNSEILDTNCAQRLGVTEDSCNDSILDLKD